MGDLARRIVLATAVLGSMTGSACRAWIITPFTDRGAFNSALAGEPITVEDFTPTDHFPITTGVLNSATNLVVAVGPPITPGLILPGVTYSTPIGTGNFFNIDLGANYTGGFLDSLNDTLPNRALTATFDSPARGFGFDVNSRTGPTVSVTINFTAGAAFSTTLNVTSSTPVFYGFASGARDISSVVIRNPGSTFAFALDNFTYTTGTTPAVPEPSSLALCGLAGVVGLAVARARRKRGA